jgi:nitrate/nitrite transport system substrate-binding protein
MRRWGQIAEAKPDAWYDEIAKSVYRPDIYKLAAEALIAEGHATPEMFAFDEDGYREPTSEFIDGLTYDGKAPNAYIDSMAIGLKGDQTVVGGAVTN